MPNYHRAYAWALVSQKEIEQGVGDPKYLEEMKSMQENILRFFQDNPEKAVETQDRALSIIGRINRYREELQSICEEHFR